MRNRTILLVLAAVCVALYRVFVSLNIRYAAMPKKEYASYCKNHSVITRWFFVSASQYCKDKYSRGERRIIHHQTHVQLYSISVILLHISLLCLTCAFILWVTGVFSKKVCDIVFVSHFSFFLFCVFVLYWIEGTRNKEYHKKRTR